MSQVHVDTIYDKAGTGRPDFPAGLTASGPCSIGGTLTYEDVTNVDSVGIITARTGIRITAGEIQVGSGATVVDTGNAEFAGIVTSNTCFKVGNGSFGPGIGVTITGDGNAIFTGITTVVTTAHVGTAITMNDSGINVSAGVITAKSFQGDGSSLTGVAATDNINTNNIQVSGITTFQSLQEPFDFWMFSG